jgi:hypothetical protein
MPLSERTGHFQRCRPSHSILHPPKIPRRVTLSWRPWPWFRRKTPKTWVESFQTRSETFNLFFFKCYISAENDSRRLRLGSKCADKSTLVRHKTPWQYWRICTVGCTCTALYTKKLKVSILFGKGNQGWKFPRARLNLYIARDWVD